MQDDNKSGLYLRIETIIKMLNKFLVEKRIPKEMLARSLEIGEEELGTILNKQASISLMQKVNLPLIKLFCATRFDNPPIHNRRKT